MTIFVSVILRLSKVVDSPQLIYAISQSNGLLLVMTVSFSKGAFLVSSLPKDIVLEGDIGGALGLVRPIHGCLHHVFLRESHILGCCIVIFFFLVHDTDSHCACFTAILQHFFKC